jgi:hypothetical protein
MTIVYPLAVIRTWPDVQIHTYWWYEGPVKLLYKPFGIVFGLAAGALAKRLFDLVWGLFDDADPPKATTARATWPKVLGAAALQAVTFKVTRAAVDRAGAKGYERLTGVWPGEVEQDDQKPD